ncbi:cell wall binding repeat-containing protein [Clostridium sp. DL-VIII]|uniref:N-acetylmuramoyl-L-alanine amidase family protein n=1 Tax=Clostridium sp. DL-VIII TaxID=641107 RepID=UPI00023B087C|nr:N-acetylmuramoyl-L-alanine amidase family protein [Clostridium sp. DL-VIII]EHJ01141.1 cell wall binding repeat-containing protein [Clostridium sp. DL-VIII]
MDDNEARWVEEEDGSYYYYYSDGTMATGWMQEGDNWYYFDDNGKMATGWAPINGDWYYFYSTGEMATSWVNDGDGWYYFYGNGSMAWGRTVKGYLLDNHGKMVTGTGWVYEDGDSYYLKDDKIATGWLQDGDNWSYLYDNGSMAWGRTVDGYYLNDNGDWVKDKGWKTEKDNDGNVTYYYVDSEIAVTGWKEIDSKWYYFDEDGKMKTGWIEDNGNWYYLNSSGAMETGQNDIDGNTYYFYSTGEMATGWVQYGDNWHYFYKDDNGSMAHDTMIGQYYVNANGDWEPSEDNNTPENIDSSNSQGTSDTKTVNISLDTDTGTIVVTDSDNNSSSIELPPELYDATKDSGLANSSKAVLAKATIEWYNADTQDEKDTILAGIKGVRDYISEHPVSEWTEKFIADTINENIGGLVGIYGDYSTGLTEVNELNDQVYYTKYAHVMRLVLSVTTDALNMGNKVHYDQLNGGTGEWLPTELQKMYPETQFNFTRRGQSGADVEFEEIPGNKHPSEYEVNPMQWPEGFNYGDFKPYTGSGYKTFLKDINKGKLPDDTVFLPYEPKSGELKVPIVE